MADINNVTLVGRVGQDIELRQFDSGDYYANMSLATSRKWKDKSGEQREETQWHRCTLFGKTAEIAAKYVHKGHMVGITGELRYRKYEKDGIEQTTTEIRVNDLMLIGGRGGEQKQAQQSTRTAPPPSKAASQQRKPAQRPEQDYDDDIPF